MNYFLNSFLLILLLASCKNFPPPRIEMCISGDGHKFICNDKRNDGDGENYEREYPLNYICTNANDYQKLYSYCADLRKQLIKCD
jgi:hypothetical protein